MKVLHLRKIIRNLPESLVRGDLFEVRLDEKLRILNILLIRPVEDNRAIAFDDLPIDDRSVAPALLPLDRQLVAPFILTLTQIGRASCRERV